MGHTSVMMMTSTSSAGYHRVPRHTPPNNIAVLSSSSTSSPSSATSSSAARKTSSSMMMMTKTKKVLLGRKKHVFVLVDKRPDVAATVAEEDEDPVMDELLLSSKLKRVDSATGSVSPRVSSSLAPDAATTTCQQQQPPRAAQKAPKTPYVILPATEGFQKFRQTSRVAVDIGGTLIKVVYSSVMEEELPEESLNGHTQKYAYGDGKRVLVNFKKFTDLDRFINFLKEVWTDRKHGDVIHCTGGGSYKYSEIIMKELGVRLRRTDEMRSLIYGVNFLLSTNVDESFTYHHDAIGRNKFQYRPIAADLIYPFLLVNIGTGISILKVDSPTSYERVGGSSMGGGTFMGLGSLLTPAQNFDELLDMANHGDHRNVDKLVCDIYGGAYDELNLKADLIAGSMAKCNRFGETPKKQTHKPADIAKSLLLMVSNNIGQMAYLYGTRYNLKRIYFGGYFIRQDPITMRTLSFAINYWSRGEIEALYLKHEGYLGAMGSFLDEDGKLDD